MEFLTDEQIKILKTHIYTGRPVKMISSGEYTEMQLVKSLLEEIEYRRDLNRERKS